MLGAGLRDDGAHAVGVSVCVDDDRLGQPEVSGQSRREVVVDSAFVVEGDGHQAAGAGLFEHAGHLEPGHAELGRDLDLAAVLEVEPARHEEESTPLLDGCAELGACGLRFQPGLRDELRTIEHQSSI